MDVLINLSVVITLQDMHISNHHIGHLKQCQSIDAFELCAGEDSWESLGLQGGPTSQS